MLRKFKINVLMTVVVILTLTLAGFVCWVILNLPMM
jgi:hypothetical protein